MVERWIDDVARTLATDGTRRGVFKAVGAGVLAGFLTTLSGGSTEAQRKDKGGKDKDKGQGQDKETLCHNGHAITVAEPAGEAHLNHGDTRGPCPAGEA